MGSSSSKKDKEINDVKAVKEMDEDDLSCKDKL